MIKMSSAKKSRHERDLESPAYNDRPRSKKRPQSTSPEIERDYSPVKKKERYVESDSRKKDSYNRKKYNRDNKEEERRKRVDKESESRGRKEDTGTSRRKGSKESDISHTSYYKDEKDSRRHDREKYGKYTKYDKEQAGEYERYWERTDPGSHRTKSNNDQYWSKYPTSEEDKPVGSRYYGDQVPPHQQQRKHFEDKENRQDRRSKKPENSEVSMARERRAGNEDAGQNAKQNLKGNSNEGRTDNAEMNSSTQQDNIPKPQKKSIDMLTSRTGGAYIPPAKLRMMQAQITDKSSAAYQRIAWEALKKSIHGHINKVNTGNIGIIVRELLKENVVRGRGLLCRSIIQAQAASPTFTHAHEIVALEILTLLIESPTDDSVEVAIAFLKECGMKLMEVSNKGVHAIFEMLRNILHEGQLDKRVHVFKFDPEYEATEAKYSSIKKEILDEGSSASESGSGSEEETDSEDESENEENKDATIIDNTETNLVALRRTIYLTIHSSLDFEECAHKLMRMELKPGQEIELCHMFLDCCAEQRTYEKFFGLLAQDTYDTIHRLDTNKLRNVAKFFAHLLFTDAISWEVLSFIHLNEEETTSSSRIFIKILFQELSEYMGLTKLNERVKDPTLQTAFDGLFPRDDPKNTRFAINFFTSIGLGGLTDELRDHLKSQPKVPVVPKLLENLESDSSDSDSSSDSSENSSDSSDDSSDDSDDSEDAKPKSRSSKKAKKQKSKHSKHRKKKNKHKDNKKKKNR
ncbi:Pre-mRNA-splicing factor CWC22 [Blattella germanica]|nr:Pre-mRNA-splicing factor CWC22 [Blattella germanica]